MKKYYKQRYVQALAGILLLVLSISSCKKFVDIDLPGSRLYAPYIFETNSSLGGALNGVYASFASTTGDNFVKTALFADETISSTDIISSQNKYMPSDNAPLSFFNNYYRVIYNANFLLMELESGNAHPNLSPDTVNLVKGECYFLRAMAHFQLTNFYGRPPIVLTTDYKVASFAPHSSVDSIYNQIISDLNKAIDLLPLTYISTPVPRDRVNKQVAKTLLAKVYLYRKDWTNAIAKSSEVISDVQYDLVTPIANIFLPQSPETIWQIFNTTGVATTVTPTWIPNPATSATTAPTTWVRDVLLKAFDTTRDLRYKAWFNIQTVTTTGPSPVTTKYWNPFKYKIRSGTGNEYLVQFRLAELVLTRAEAYAQNNNVPDAITDVQKIRTRAGITTPLPSDITATQLLDTIAVERRRELVFEAGNRWFDLNRTGKTVATLKAIDDKKDFEAYRMLLPYFNGSPGVVGTNPNMIQNPIYPQ